MSEDDIIHRYTRAEAIADGVLVDVTPQGREAGFRHPVALTRAAWEAYVAVPAGAAGQDEQGRLWDVLWMLRHASARSVPGISALRFTVYVRNGEVHPRPCELKAVCGPGDDLEPVITVLLPHED